MRRQISSVTLALVTGLYCSGCGYTSTPNAGIVGGFSGGAIGAGTGAIIASSISNGDVGKSALVGGAIGIPVGIMLGIAYNNYQYHQIVDGNQDQIDRNKARISESQQDIEALRATFQTEASEIQVDPTRAEWIYDGPSVGQPRR